MIESAVFNERTFTSGDRVYCFYHDKWYAGTVIEIVPAEYEYLRPVYEASLKRYPNLEIISEENGRVRYKDPSDSVIKIKTDELVDQREGRLFDGYGLSYIRFGVIIFEYEETYDASMKISSASDEDEELPF